MRRQPILLAVGLIAVVGVSGASAAATSNSTLTATIAEAGWDTYDPATGAGEFGAVQAVRESGETYILLQRSVGEIALCEGGDTPDDPTDDFYGFVGRQIFGSGPATLSIGRQYTSAKASGTVTAEVALVNECTGSLGAPTARTYKVSMSLTAVSGLIRETSRSILRAPSELTSHTMIRGSYREAAGTVKVGALTIDADAIIGQLTLRTHDTAH